MEEMQRFDEQRFKKASELLAAFNKKFVGMNELKRFLHREMVRAEINHNESPDKLQPGPIILVGNPGTGKTTAAKMISEMYYTLGLLESAVPSMHPAVEIRSHLIGATTENMRKTVMEAQEQRKLLFVDEAHLLIDPSMREAFCVLMELLADINHPLLLVLAVYPQYLERMLQINPHFACITHVIHLPDYSGEELHRIFHKKLDGEYSVSDEADRLLRRIFESLASLPAERSGNARIAEKLVRELRERCRKRCIQMQIPDTENRIVEEDDIPQHYLDLLQNET